MSRVHGRTKVSIVAPIIVRFDAISTSVYNTYRFLSNEAEFEVSVICGHNEIRELPVRLVGGVKELLFDDAFAEADVIIYHFGIYHPFFDALLVGNGRAAQIVRFHNVTPMHLVEPEMKSHIERSFRQLHNLAFADRFWADSRVNGQVLIDYGVARERIEVLPIAVEQPDLGALSNKADDIIRLLFVGRVCQSKGLLDGLQALGQAIASGSGPVHLSIVCNLAFSNQQYLELCRQTVSRLKLDKAVTFCGTLGNAERDDLYRSSHILLLPSYHEGFCVPVIEALRAGCVPIGYNATNMPHIINGLGCLAPLGDFAELGRRLTGLIEGIRLGLKNPASPHLPLARGQLSIIAFDRVSREYVQRFNPDRVARLTVNSLRTILMS